MLVDERLQGRARLGGTAVGQVLDQGLAAHEGYDGLGRVVAALLVAAGDQFFEDLAKHLGIDGDVDLQWRALGHGEVVTGEEATFRVENRGDGLVGNDHTGAIIFGVSVKKATVQIGNIAHQIAQDTAAIDGHQVAFLRVVERRKEEQPQAVGVEIGRALRLRLRVPIVISNRSQVVGAVAKTQPALALDEGEEHQAVEQPLGEQAQRLLVGKRWTDQALYLVEHAPVVAKELLE